MSDDHGWITKERMLAWLLLAAFVAVAATTMLHHEMWRDEVRAWQLASADSLAGLLSNARAEGHPGLWFLALFPLTRLTTDPAAMQLLHLAIAVSAAAVVIFTAPFGWIWRALIVFGYFPLYEYGVISRNYSLGVLLMVAFCAVYPGRSRHPVAAALLLFLLAQTNPYALILSFALGAMWFFEDRVGTGGKPGASTGFPSPAVVLWILGLTASVVQLTGALEVKHPFTIAKAAAPNRVLTVLASPWQGTVPLPTPKLEFWNTNILDGAPGGLLLQAALAPALIALMAGVFARRPPVLLLYLLGSAAQLAFSFFLYVGQIRHDGHHFLLLLACLWLAGPPVSRRLRLAVTVLLAANMCAGVYAVARDLRDPFSAGSAVAEYIRAHDLDRLPVVGHRDTPTSTVAAFLQRPLYYPSLGRETSFIPWNSPDRRWDIDNKEVLRQARRLARRHSTDVLIVFSRSGRPRPPKLGKAVRIADFSETIVRKERFELYRLPAPQPR